MEIIERIIMPETKMSNNPEHTYQITQIILEAIKNTKAGKHRLAEFLKGSKAKDVAHLSSNIGYGGLLWHDIGTIMGFIEQLERMELIKRTAILDYYSALELTEAGEKILDEKIKIELQIVKKEKPVTVGETERLTYDMFKKGASAEQIAKQRNLAVSTIYGHLYGLVANNYLSSSDFIPENVIAQVLKAKNKLPAGFKLREIKEILAEYISYNEIKCVLADKNAIIKKESEDEEGELWSGGYFAETADPGDLKNKMRTFHMKHDEEMNYSCKECSKKISAHNRDWHNAMCDGCFDKKYFPDNS